MAAGEPVSEVRTFGVLSTVPSILTRRMILRPRNQPRVQIRWVVSDMSMMSVRGVGRWLLSSRAGIKQDIGEPGNAFENSSCLYSLIFTARMRCPIPGAARLD